MARLHEYQGKGILAKAGIAIPRGWIARGPEAAGQIAAALGGAAVVKAQVWATSRAARNLIRFVDSPSEAEAAARDMLGRQVDHFTIDAVLVEERVPVEREFYLALTVDDRERRPVIVLSGAGGSGVEAQLRERPTWLARYAVDVRAGLQDSEARALARGAGLDGKPLLSLSETLVKFYDAARAYEGRSVEINPLALSPDGRLIALDCRFTVDDNAVFRHPELGIEIAREMDRPPTALERIAWNVEKDDPRGSFYFVQMETDFSARDRVVGLHGSGGGAMMNMDALLRRGFKVADFADTSGSAPASKVYRAARIVLAQPGIDAYFMGGSGVAGQDQSHAARGLVKAFMDAGLNVPAVIRVGGSGEERAIEILLRANGAFPAPVEAYGRDDTPDFCAERLADLVEHYTPDEVAAPRATPPMERAYSFETVTGGTVSYDHMRCLDCETKACVATCVPGILSLDGEVPVLNISREDARRGGCVECLACEVECYFHGNQGGLITLPIPGLNGTRHGNSD